MRKTSRDVPLLSESVADDAHELYPHLKDAEAHIIELRRYLAAEEIARLEKELNSVRDELFALTVSDVGVDVALVDFGKRFLDWIDNGCPIERR